jgi:hypothetical protein
MSEHEPAWLRRAGTGRQPDGSLVTWSVAEGARGRRWRWTLSDDAGLRHAGLVELDAGGFARLELECRGGMLTLHPDRERTMAHGNVVRAEGVEPLAVPWSDGEGIAIEGDEFGSAVAGWQGRGWVVGRGLRLRRLDDAAESAPGLALPADDRGVPELLDAQEWPLES